MTPEELKLWLEQEVYDLTRATQLRLTDAVEVATSYISGAISEHEAHVRLVQYQNRWGDSPIPGLPTNPRMTDDHILAILDHQTTDGESSGLAEASDQVDTDLTFTWRGRKVSLPTTDFSVLSLSLHSFLHALMLALYEEHSPRSDAMNVLGLKTPGLDLSQAFDTAESTAKETKRP